MCDAPRQGIAVGFFDGVHRGHQAILETARVALTFRNHPLSVLKPSLAPRLIMPFAARAQAIRQCGVEEVVALDFTPALAALPPEAFARTYLTEKHVRCGENWHFGCGGSGNAALLRALGFTVEVVPFAILAGARVSSTRIRAAIESGAIAEANDMLGRAFSVTGHVQRGKGLGRVWGSPTLNLEPVDLELRLPRGVYAVEALGRRAVANYGVAPTLGARAWEKDVLEVHFLDDVPETSGIESCGDITVAFRAFLRAERAFPSTDALQAQIRDDCLAAKLLFDKILPNQQKGKNP